MANLAVFKTHFSQTPVVNYPNGGEILTAGTEVILSWSGVPNGNIVGIDYTTDNWATTTWISINITSTGEFSWLVPNEPSEQCKIGVFNTDFEGDISDDFFTIELPSSSQDELNTKFEVEVYPNPVADWLTVRFVSDLTLRFKVYSITGELQNENFSKMDDSTYIINTHNLASGIYFIQVLNENDRVILTRKFIHP